MFFNDATTAFTAATFAAIEKEVSSMFFSESSSTTTTMTTQDAGNENNNSLWTWVTVLPLGYYSLLSVYSNVLDCYNFFAAWNMISGTHRIDLEILHFHKNDYIQRSMEMDRVLDNRLYSDVLAPSTTTTTTTTTLACETSTTTTSSKECPICLTDFCADDMVSSCKDQPTCQHLFHKGCLEAWLQKQQSCPCCRYEILPITPPQHPLLR
jgi:hypothetical protein